MGDPGVKLMRPAALASFVYVQAVRGAERHSGLKPQRTARRLMDVGVLNALRYSCSVGDFSNHTGKLLEEAVRGIESALLAMNPAAQTANYRVETRRVFVIDGVRHEVDVYVKVDLGACYDAVVLFECKNWRHKSVGKNEVIILSEKVRALSASKGCLVARGFSPAAKAQAKQDKRISLLHASDTAPIWPQLEYIHVLGRDRGDYKANVVFIAPPGASRDSIVPLNGIVTVDGKSFSSIDEFIRPLVEESVVECLTMESTHELPAGSYRRDVSRKLLFASATVGNVAVAGLQLQVDFGFHIARPAIESVFDVESRGRIYKTEITSLGPSYISMTYVLPSASPAAG